MGRGKSTCKVLKEVRREIARANGIPLEERKCTFTGDCAGTCPYCEAEVRYLEREIAKRRSVGQTVKVAGIVLSTATMVGCSSIEPVSTVADQPPHSSGRPVTDALATMGAVDASVQQSPKSDSKKSPDCTTYQVSRIERKADTTKRDGDSPVPLDSVIIEYTPPDFEPDGTSSISVKIVKNVWRFPSEYGTLKSYLHKELKKNPELRDWLKEKAKQKRMKIKSDPLARMIAREYRRQDPFKPKDNYFVLSFNQEGEVVNAYLRYELKGEEDERMSEAFFHIVENMPRWTLNPWESRPNGLVSQHYPYRYLR